MWGFKRLVDRFKEVLRHDILGRQVYTIARAVYPDVSNKELAARMVIESFAPGFEKACQSFTGFEADTIDIPFRGKELPRIHGMPLRERCLELNKDVLRRIMDEYAPHIFEPLHNQIQKVKASSWGQDSTIEIVFAGGGSLCEYLQKKMQAEFSDYSISCDEKEDYSMVAKGAFYLALDEKLGQGIFATAYIGLALTAPFDKKLGHTEADRVPAKEWTPKRIKYEVENCFYPGIAPGIRPDDPKAHSTSLDRSPYWRRTLSGR